MTPQEQAVAVVREIIRQGAWVWSNDGKIKAEPIIAAAIRDAVVEERLRRLPPILEQARTALEPFARLAEQYCDDSTDYVISVPIREEELRAAREAWLVLGGES